MGEIKIRWVFIGAEAVVQKTQQVSQSLQQVQRATAQSNREIASSARLYATFANAAFFTALSGIFLVMALNRQAQSARMVEEAFDRVERSIENVRQANLSFGESSSNIALLQGNLADIQGIVEQATRETGEAAFAYTQAVASFGPTSIEAAFALAEVRAKQEEWGDVLRIGGPLVRDAESAIRSNTDATDAYADSQAAAIDQAKALRANIIVTGASIFSQIASVVAMTAALKGMTIAQILAQAFTVKGIALIAVGIGAAGVGLAFVEGTLPGLQRGGIITQPTLAMIGERGPEAVVPLERFRGREDIHLHVNLDGEEIAKSVFRRARA